MTKQAIPLLLLLLVPFPCVAVPGDVSPGTLDAGVWCPEPDGLVNIADVVVVLRTAVGLQTIKDLGDGGGGDPQALADLEERVTALESENGELRAMLTTLGEDVAELKDRFTHVSRDGDDLTITGANVHLVSGAGTTAAEPNGLGNLIIGYNEERVDDLDASTDDTNVRTGSHVLAIGSELNYSSAGGIVAGFRNTIAGLHACVTGGAFNEATEAHASVVGGLENEAADEYATVAGGTQNEARGRYSSVLGGEDNEASGSGAAVLGGQMNQASGRHATVAGGLDNLASGLQASVSAGRGNEADDDASSVSGGRDNTASGRYSSVSGGEDNRATNSYSSVSGGLANQATGRHASVSGGTLIVAAGDTEHPDSHGPPAPAP